MRLGLRLAICLLLMGGTPVAWTAPEDAPAQRFRRAFDADSSDAMRRIAEDPSLDPIAIARDMLKEHLASKEADTTWLDVARKLGEMSKGRADGAALPGIVKRWAGFGAEEWAYERARHQRMLDQISAFEKRDAKGVFETAEQDKPPFSVLSIDLMRRHAAVRHFVGETNNAIALLERTAKLAGNMGWLREQADVLAQWVRYEETRKDLDALLRARTLELEVWTRIGLAVRIGGSLCNLGIAHERRKEWGKAREHHVRALAILEQAGHEMWAANARFGLGLALWHSDEQEKALELIEQATRTKRSRGDLKGTYYFQRRLAQLLHASKEPDAAVPVYEGLARLGQKISPRDVAWAHQELGMLHMQRGRWSEAAAAYRTSSDLWQKAGDPLGAGRALTNVSAALSRLRRYPEAVGAAHEAVPLLEEHGDGLDMAMIQYNLGIGLRALRKYAEARHHLEAADRLYEDGGYTSDLEDVGSELCEVYAELKEHQLLKARAQRLVEDGRKAGSRASMAFGRLWLGHYHEEAALDWERAEQHFLEALRLRRQLGVPQGIANVYNALAGFLYRQDRSAEALEAYEHALVHAQAGQSSEETARAHQGIGYLMIELERGGEARRHFERAREHYRTAGNLRRALLQSIHVADSHLMAYDHEDALAAYEKAAKELRAANIEAPACHLNRAITLVQLGRYDEAEAGLRTYREQRERERSMGDAWLVPFYLADIAKKRNRLERANELLQQSLVEARKEGTRNGERLTQFQLACVALRRGRPHEALEAARAMGPLGRRMALGFADPESVAAMRGTSVSSGVGLLAIRDLARRDAESWELHQAEAFRFAESTRGQFLAEQIRNRERVLRAHLPAALLEAEKEAQRKVDALQGKGAALDEAYEALRSIQDRMRREARRLASVVRVEPVGLAKFQASLEPDQTALIYQFCERELLLMVVTREAARLETLGKGREIREQVERYLRLATVAGSEERKLGARLYDALLKPVGKLLHERLLVLPDGILAFLPFEALGTNGRRVIEAHRVSYLPSATVMGELEARPRGKMLVALGDPVYPGEGGTASRDASVRGLADLGRIPGSGDEVRRVGALFAQRVLLLRAEATEAALRGAITGETGVLHLACHGHVDASRPRLTGLVLSNAEVLTLEDIARLDVHAALVVLSACETARGKYVNGEGVVGLARAFFLAGAPRVVVSNWKVSDMSTRDLMLSFYTKMLKEKLAPAAALRAAKLEMMKQHPHPYHWAGFVSWGLE